MTKPAGNPTAAHGTSPQLGVLVTNLGTPDGPTSVALRRYLAEFLSDPCVVDLPRLVWWPLLYGLVLPFRPKHSAEAYARIWTSTGSPLLSNTLAISRALEIELQTRLGGPVTVATGMRYGRPSLRAALAELMAAHPTQTVVLPLYPQYARATAGSTRIMLDKILTAHSPAAAIKFVNVYYQHPGYISALAASVREHWTKHGRGQMLLVSFHGIPKRAVRKGDPYADQCVCTARQLATALHLRDNDWRLMFQSRFGKAEWLKPYTEETLRELAACGVKTVDVICPGFAVDCLETLEEIALRYAEVFRQAGGGTLRYVPALNDRREHIAALAELVTASLRAPIEPNTV